MIAIGTSAAAFYLALQHILTGHEWMYTQSIIAGMFKAANVIDKKLGGKG